MNKKGEPRHGGKLDSIVRLHAAVCKMVVAQNTRKPQDVAQLQT